DPLVMPAHQALSLCEMSRVDFALSGYCVEHRIMEAEEQCVELRNDNVLVIALIADESPARACTVARQVRSLAALWKIVFIPPKQQMRPVGLIEERLIVGPRTIERIEIKARRAKILQGIGIVEAIERGDRIECDVMVDELAEISVPG